MHFRPTGFRSFIRLLLWMALGMGIALILLAPLFWLQIRIREPYQGYLQPEVRVVVKSCATVNEIAKSVNYVSTGSREVAQNVTESAKGLSEVAQSVNGLSEAASEIVQGISQIKTNAGDLAELSKQLKLIVGKMKIT